MFSKQSSDSWLIVGLGNPGREYEKTRHNTGFRAMDILAEKLNAKVDRLKFQGLYTQVNYGGKKLFLLKPQTYMNLSGRSVLQLSAYFGIPPQRIIVMFDDISLEPGRLRVRAEGSPAGTTASSPSFRSWAVRISPGSRSGLAQSRTRNTTLPHGCCPPSRQVRKRRWPCR